LKRLSVFQINEELDMTNTVNNVKQISILFLGTQMAVGGAQNVLLNQAQWFFDRGYQVTAAFFYDKENLKRKWDSQYPFPVIDLNARRLTANPVANIFLLIGGIIRLWKLILSPKIDLLETFTPDSNILGLFIGRLAGVQVRIGSHHGYIEGAPNWRIRLHGWMVNHGFAHCLVAVSEDVYRIAIEKEKIQPDKIKVILNGIKIIRAEKPQPEIRARLRAELGLSPEDFIYISVGRLTLQKGHTYLLDAVPRILERYPKNTVFIIAGGGNLRESLERKVAILGIERFVHFLGTRSDIPDLLLLADVFVMPSLSEGLPLALLEAMSAGLPIVASGVGGIKTVIYDGENGYLLPLKDVEALSSALIEIRGDEAARKKFSISNKDLILRKYTLEKMCRQYETLFLQIYQQEMSG
jgi:glycosyltransferase involved in cell wall biosynthesis